MDKQHIITISGKPGSGKSSTADKVAELLSYTRYSAGDLVRNIIRKKGLTLEEFNKQASQDHDIDREIDEELRNLRSQNDIVVDSRLGFYWIPESFKVYLDLDDDVATARIFRDMDENKQRDIERGGVSDITDAKKVIEKRLNDERERFVSMYGVNPFDRQHYDLVVNTSRHSPQTVALAVFDNYQLWLKAEEWTQVYSEVPPGYSLKNKY